MVAVAGRLRSLFAWPTVVVGTDASGNVVNLGAAGGGLATGGSGLPYGADTQVITSVAAGPSVIVYKSGGTGGTTLKTRTLTYTNAGVSSTDVLVSTVDT